MLLLRDRPAFPIFSLALAAFICGACTDTEVGLEIANSDAEEPGIVDTTEPATDGGSSDDSTSDTEGSTDPGTEEEPAVVNSEPVAALQVSPLLGFAPLEVTFDASATTDDDNPDDVIKYRFDFDGDGQWDTEFDIQPVVTQVLEEPGMVFARVEVQDMAGATSIATAPEAVVVSQVVEPGDLTVNILVDSNRDGVVDSLDELTEETQPAIFPPNLDDDDSDGQRDGVDDVVNGSGDLRDMARIELEPIAGLGDGHVVVLEVGPSVANNWVRVFRAAPDETYELIKGLEEGAARLEQGWLEEESLTLYFEGIIGRFQDFDGDVTIKVQILQDDEVISEDTVTLAGAPIIFSDDTNLGERLFVTEIPQSAGPDHNEALISAFEEHLPEYIELYKLNGPQYEYDRWVQDSMQTGYFQRPGVDGVETTWIHFETQRPRPLAAFLTDELLGPDSGYVFPRGSNTSLNSGGNIEVVPAHSTENGDYPYGRMVYGGGSAGSLLGVSYADDMNQNQVNFFNSQSIQGPSIQVSTEWLAVGHVDEIFLFLPNVMAEDGERPWKVVIASPTMAVTALEELAAEELGELPVFEGRDAETTVNAILENDELMNYQGLAQARIDSIRELLKGEVGLTDADFVEVPVLYEYIVEGGGWGQSALDMALAYNPGIQNLVIADSALFIPDPEGPDRDGLDVWQEQTRASLAGMGFDLHFVDVFKSYHEQFGEAHCGTNLERTPSLTPWWEM